jgi:hypothetical protein
MSDLVQEVSTMSIAIFRSRSCAMPFEGVAMSNSDHSIRHYSTELNYLSAGGIKLRRGGGNMHRDVLCTADAESTRDAAERSMARAQSERTDSHRCGLYARSGSRCTSARLPERHKPPDRSRAFPARLDSTDAHCGFPDCSMYDLAFLSQPFWHLPESGW